MEFEVAVALQVLGVDTGPSGGIGIAERSPSAAHVVDDHRDAVAAALAIGASPFGGGGAAGL
ncbi:hypothetical protein [Micromonospora sp. CPCC 206061]|uniref:hypothetical protein n=1 Tax=Micromonospora sp. CPCC 206061 TaxID=3122410 RepID=UPI002FF3F69B